jgi:nicotinamidase-related amidase
MYAVLVLEMQKDTVSEGGAVEMGERGRTIVPNIQRLIDAARERKVPIIYGNLCCIPSDSLVKKFPIAHCVIGTPGTDVIEELKPEAGDYLMNTYAIDAFIHTSLEHVLRALGIATVIVTGITTDGSCLLTAMGAFQRSFNVVLVSDGCVTYNEERQQAALKYLKPFVKILNSDEVIKLLKGDV